MAKKQSDYFRAIFFALAAFVFMSLFWKFLGSLINSQTGYLVWSWNLVRKLTTWGFTVIAFFGGLE